MNEQYTATAAIGYIDGAYKPRAELALPMTDELFDAVCAQTPPQMPALAEALTIESRLIWATAPAAQVNADIVYTTAMLHDLLGAMHPVFTRSSVARSSRPRVG